MPITFETSGFEFVSGDMDVPVAAVERGIAPAGLESAGVDEVLLKANEFEAKPGQKLVTSTGGQATVLIGLGDDEATRASIRERAASMYGAVSSLESVSSALVVESADAVGAQSALESAIEGVLLASYRFEELKGSPKDPAALSRVVLSVPDGVDTDAAVERASGVASGVALARDLVNRPGGTLRAADLAAAAVAAVEGSAVDIEVWDVERIREERLGGLLAVNAGSVHEPRLIKWSWRPDGAERTIVLVGKGITFDTGGLSLKPGEGMMNMKTDMGGAAAVVGTAAAIAAVAPNCNVIGIACCTDNQPGPTALMPGDVFTARNGKTVEVLNTDAEGRLVLADGLSLAAEMEPDAIVDLATLTGACVVALGMDIAGLMGNDDDLVEKVEEAAAAASEQVWHLPLPDKYRKQLDSDVADLKNIGAGRWGGTLTAGLFLQEFVDEHPWVHLDIAGPAATEEASEVCPKGGTGFGVRTLLELVSEF
ncbi:MAG: leucyl aminopeptidase [Actinomycetia bacterium]|nr:leucyl aminopeptidase [Actinomycetes bacterium]